MSKVGELVHINYMSGEPEYIDREGRITSIDSMGHLHGTWGGLAIIPGEDDYYIVPESWFVPM